MERFRERIEQRLKQTKKKLRGYTYVSHTKSDCPAPKQVPEFDADTPAALRAVYADYECMDLQTSTGRIVIQPYGAPCFGESDEARLSKTHDLARLREFVAVHRYPQVVFHPGEETLYVVEGSTFVPLTVSLEVYLDWLVFFLGIEHFPYFFVEDTAAHAGELQIANQTLNLSFYEEDVVPEWFEHELPAGVCVHPALKVGDRVKDARYSLSGEVTEIKKTKATVHFDFGAVAKPMVRMLVPANDDVYEALIAKRKQVLDLSLLELHALGRCGYARIGHEFRRLEGYGCMGNLHILKPLYEGLELRTVFRHGIDALAGLREGEVSQLSHEEQEFVRMLVLSGMYVACFWHLREREDASLAKALGAALTKKARACFAAEEEHTYNVVETTPIGYFAGAFEQWSQSDFDPVGLDAPPAGF